MNEPLFSHLMTKDSQMPFELPDWIALAPFENYLGMHIEEAADGHAVLSMPFRAIHCQGKGLMHGGAVVTLADTALAMAIKSLLPEDTHFVTVEMSLKFHAPVIWGILKAKASITHHEGRAISGEVELITEDGIKAATFTARFRVKRGQ